MMRSGANETNRSELLCPSGRPEIPGARAFGVVDHSEQPPTTAFLDDTVPITPELLAMAAPLPPVQVFRFSSPCQKQRCAHWDGACTLADRIVKILPVATVALPPCRIRTDCRWFAEQGREACRRCPQIVTEATRPSEMLSRAAKPPKLPAAAPDPDPVSDQVAAPDERQPDQR